MPGFSRGLQLSTQCGVIPSKSPGIPVLWVLQRHDLPRHAVTLTPGWVSVALGGFYGRGKDLWVRLGHEDGVGGATWALTAKPALSRV